MSLLLRKNITISPFHAESSGHSTATNKYLVQVEHLNFVVSTPVKLLIESLLTQQSSNGCLKHIYCEKTGKSISVQSIEQLAKEHIPEKLFENSEIGRPIKPFIFSVTLLPQFVLQKFTHKFSWLFSPIVASAFVITFLIVHLLSMSDITASVHSAIGTEQLLPFIGLMILSYFIHEFGHIAACRKFGCDHGGIGFGIYLVFPVFYADVSKAWSLTQKQRAVIDTGGIYFQMILLIGVDAYAYLNASHMAYLLSWAITFTMLHTLNPFFKFDGYWLLSDLSGITNLHEKMRGAITDLTHTLLRGKQLPSKNRKYLYLLIPYSLMALAFFVYVAIFLGKKLVSSVQDFIALEVDWSIFSDVSTFANANGISLVLELVFIVVWPFLIFLLLSFYIKRIAGLFHSDNKQQVT